MFSAIFTRKLSQQRQKVGETVKERLKRLYGDHTVYSYKDARPILYNTVDCENNKIWLEYSSTRYDWQCGGSNIPSLTIVNAEHTVPQSLFDSKTPMVSDFHHLFASPTKLNSARSNFAFDEFDYSKCSKWCQGEDCQTTKPSGSMDDWDCVSNNKWMPRAADRGRIARAVFYFYTIYPQYSINDVGTVDIFKKWNSQFPPDDREKTRNDKINQTQHNRNPYVDDPSLVNQAW